MARPIRIMVACGSGIATSVHASVKLREKLSDRGIVCEINTCSISELQDRATGYDLIVSTAQVSFPTEQRVINGVPLLMGFGDEPIIDEVEEVARKLQSEGEV